MIKTIKLKETRKYLFNDIFDNNEFYINAFSGRMYDDFGLSGPMEFLSEALRKLIKLGEKVYPTNTTDWADWPNGGLRDIQYSNNKLKIGYLISVPFENDEDEFMSREGFIEYNIDFTEATIYVEDYN
jgi:hypothetical protein